MPGIKETKEVMVFGVSAAIAVDAAAKDGFQLIDLFAMVPALVNLPAAIGGIGEVPAELADMDDAERLELVAEVEKMEFNSEDSEAIAEQGLRAGVEIGKLIVLIRNLKK